MPGYFKATESLSKPHNEEIQHCHVGDANNNVTVDGVTTVLAVAAGRSGENTSHADDDNVHASHLAHSEEECDIERLTFHTPETVCSTTSIST